MPIPTRHPSITPDRVIDLVRADDQLGVCVCCGEEAYSIEPDRRRGICESCGQRGVFGAEELLFMLDCG